MSDTAEKIILNYDKPYYKITIDIVIREHETNNDLDFDFILKEKLEEYWNDDNNKAYNFMRRDAMLSSECNLYDIITTIEYMYDEINEEFDDSLNKTTLEDKLDLVYYFKAEEYFRNWLEKEDFEVNHF